MVFSYSTDAPTDVHKVRLLLADTEREDEAGNQLFVFHDEELQSFLDLNAANIYGAAADATEAKLADMARFYAFKLGRGGAGSVEVSVAEARKSLEAQVARWRQRAADAQGMELWDWSDAQHLDLEGAVLGRRFDSYQEEVDGGEFSG